ncbi:flagellar basal body rod protein FlgB [Lacrimispora sp.]|uniref:flagellar basal body rod protein FlgB n=1 Tax=Lacrimispora sp. TaxID=2719234 RepID=UPI002FDB59C2
MNGIFGNSISMAEKALGHLWSRQQVTLNNIANVETPGYKARYVTFEDEFRRRLQTGRQGAGTSRDMGNIINSSRYFIHDTKNESARMDGNNVNLDVENVELARTNLQYQYQLNALNSEVSRLRTVIKS